MVVDVTCNSTYSVVVPITSLTASVCGREPPSPSSAPSPSASVLTESSSHGTSTAVVVVVVVIVAAFIVAAAILGCKRIKETQDRQKATKFEKVVSPSDLPCPVDVVYV